MSETPKHLTSEERNALLATAARSGREVWLNLTDPAHLDAEFALTFGADSIRLDSPGHHVHLDEGKVRQVHAALTGWLDRGQAVEGER